MLVGMGDVAGPELTANVERALRVMEAAGAHAAEVPVQQLARETGLPLAGVQRLLNALAQDGYLTELDDGAFTLSGRRSPWAPNTTGTSGWTVSAPP